MTAFWDIMACSLVEVDQRFTALTMEAVRTSETCVYFETAWRYTREGCSLHVYFGLILFEILL
jgi:hypothetical protein